MMDAKSFAEIQKTVSDVALGYSVPNSATYNRHVRSLIAERKELLEKMDLLEIQRSALEEQLKARDEEAADLRNSLAQLRAEREMLPTTQETKTAGVPQVEVESPALDNFINTAVPETLSRKSKSKPSSQEIR